MSPKDMDRINIAMKRVARKGKPMPGKMPEKMPEKGTKHEAVHRLPPGAKSATCKECGGHVDLKDSRVMRNMRTGQCEKCGAMHASPKKGEK